tara:strand:- start:65 stop:1189 length:1125 start_codon:yes stop_codon:yes gene_type:complete
MTKLKVIDLFAGCGGLSLGFKKSNYDICASIEIENAFCQTLEANANKKELILNFDITEEDKYINRLKSHIGKKIDGVIGGPPCQAYSLAGRINKNNKMHEDPRNFLFESFNNILREFRPNFFVFENVVGMLSAKPHGINVTQQIKNEFINLGYSVSDDFRNCIFDTSDYGVPQKRKRVIIFGYLNSKNNKSEEKVEKFYKQMRSRTTKVKTVKDAIADLPKIFPKNISKKISHVSNESFSEHQPRFHNQRDIEIFKLLAKDIEDGNNKFISTKALKEIYKKFTGKESKVHKYHVLRWDKPSNTIPAHLYKDGLRHIHPDSSQARSITIREAARLMSFPDDYVLHGSMGDKYKMLGNAVPPIFARVIADTIKKII